ncbi:hypothetical protein HRbin17_02754 [bacterium HR17]|uniref:VCBS repeat-containing protein n=1 Tax=Candidatus Fervidibacter japonicus TaxID=2035412 RepID=A0A2H5XGB4_9BACT|nr:hypothetical protein HRbin17_02754 [bacterium HR17]
MRCRWLIGITVVAVSVVFCLAAWRHATALKVRRTVTAELPRSLNTLAKTDLDADGAPELLVTCATVWTTSNFVWHISDRDGIADPRIWLIRSPQKNPKVTQLPYVCRLTFPTTLPPLRAVPVEDGEWRDFGAFRQWLPRRLGWLQMRDGKMHFEPFCATGQFTQQLVTGSETATLFIFNDLRLISSSPSTVQRQRNLSQRFAFRLHPDGTWQRLDPMKIRPPTRNYVLTAAGDFDGDGLTDTVIHQSKRLKRQSEQWLEVRWGNGASATLLPAKFSDLERFNATDVDMDGRGEIVTIDSSLSHWRLTVWQFRPAEHRFVPLAQLTSPLPVQLSTPTQSSVSSTTVKPPQPPAVLEPTFYVADIDGDGLKDFIVVWTKSRFPHVTCGLSVPYLPPPECVAVQVVWWQGKNLRSRSFLAHEVAFPKSPTSLWTLNDHRLAVVEGSHQKRRPTFRLFSLHPLRVQLWETEREQRCAILRIPDGDAALDLRRWTKTVELPASLRLWGDWDGDGHLELLLEQTFVQAPLYLTPFRKTPVPAQTVTHSVLYLVRWDGDKLRWAKLAPPSPAKVVSILPLSARDGIALFVLWQTRDKTLLERIYW